ncbi:kunitz-type serine protease inhibitor textilinin-7-like [Bacillus rossius redtenbacheri]|uniref:kunitz-type serine protease inhibitor textilinin-7-like n=1 Tax=Bacillus rossius redtenbacheri TaxID=93214 RepID=UPI002FDD7C43
MFGTKLCLMLLCCVAMAVYEVEGTGDSCCELAADPGPCLSFVGRYHYDFRAQRCEIFDYGGCGGNCNNFQTAYECRSNCDRDWNSI